MSTKYLVLRDEPAERSIIDFFRAWRVARLTRQACRLLIKSDRALKRAEALKAKIDGRMVK